MKQTTLRNLYVNELEDLLSAEAQLVRALPNIIAAVESKELAATLTSHLKETEGHIERLKEVFELAGELAQAKTCEAMKGLIKEGTYAIGDIEKGAVRDAALIGVCRRVEHYEMAAYETTRAIAKTLGYGDQASLLTQSLGEESNANENLSKLAATKVNPAANMTPVGASR